MRFNVNYILFVALRRFDLSITIKHIELSLYPWYALDISKHWPLKLNQTWFNFESKLSRINFMNIIEKMLNFPLPFFAQPFHSIHIWNLSVLSHFAIGYFWQPNKHRMIAQKNHCVTRPKFTTIFKLHRTLNKNNIWRWLKPTQCTILRAFQSWAYQCAAC